MAAPRRKARARVRGGGPARRAMARWGWRLFRRDWRGQLLLITLLAVTVAGAIFGGSAAFNVSALPNARFGSATQLLSFDGADPGRLAADVAAARKAVRDDRGHRPPLRADPRIGQDGGAPDAGPLRTLRQVDACPARRQLPGGRRRGGSHRGPGQDLRRGRRRVADARRPGPKGRRPRREPAGPQRPVRADSAGRGRAGPVRDRAAQVVAGRLRRVPHLDARRRL